MRHLGMQAILQLTQDIQGTLVFALLDDDVLVLLVEDLHCLLLVVPQKQVDRL